jgi:hypothetical protein
MTTQDQIDFCKLLERVINDELKLDFVSSDVTKRSWSTDNESKFHSEFWRIVNDLRSSKKSRGAKVRSYQLQRSAVISETFDVKDGLSPSGEKSFVSSIVYIWKSRFREELARIVDHRPIVRRLPDVPYILDDCYPEWINPDCYVEWLKESPRTSLFGKTVLRYSPSQNGEYRIFNPKYDQCPKQLLIYNAETAYFLFPDKDRWIGEVAFRESTFNGDGKGHFRWIGSSATQPVRTDQGALITILPRGLRGLLYQIVWKLLRIKP